MAQRDNYSSPPAGDNVQVRPAPTAQNPPSNFPLTENDLEGPSSLLLDSDGGAPLPVEIEQQAPSAVLPPRPGDSALPAVGESQPATVHLDHAPRRPSGELDLPPFLESRFPPPPSEGERAEMRSVLLEELLPDEASAPPPVSRPAAPTVKPAIADIAEAAGPSSLLFSGERQEAAPPERVAPQRATPRAAPPSEATREMAEKLLTEPSRLLIGSGWEMSAEQSAEAAIEQPRRRRRRRERVRLVPPRLGAKVEWFSSPDACAIYCRKRSRPLLLYFRTGVMEECRSYEEAIRMAELQPFLCPYVCCIVNMAEPEGCEAALRLGIPTDGPAMVMLSPLGREYARILKSDVDWQFLATMLFWALR
ncbi:hypothetical protein FJY63_02035 [Candidatus Sumerlaeota bacterium]|nr:hypothetical protein [Candidatus Sumerlaeota bacterium]